MWNRIRITLMNWLNRFRIFMIGRNGSDQFNLALLIAYLVLSVFSSFFIGIRIVYAILYVLSLALLVVFFWRFFSRNVASRQLENERFLNWWNPTRYALIQWKNRITDRDHVYVKCKRCGQRLRLPKRRGRLNVTCPKCGNRFIKKT
jgi:predicted RNA-binding Zn-ribbon protein involved in translation (DUF1610 family)